MAQYDYTKAMAYLKEKRDSVRNDMGRSRGHGRKFLKDFFDRQFPVQDMIIPSEGAAVKEAERKQRQGMFGPNNYMDEDINSRYPYRY